MREHNRQCWDDFSVQILKRRFAFSVVADNKRVEMAAISWCFARWVKPATVLFGDGALPVSGDRTPGCYGSGFAAYFVTCRRRVIRDAVRRDV